MSSEIKNKAIKGGIFLTASNIITQLLAVGLNIVLARLLLAEAFGLIALATTYIGFITLFTSIGFGSSIIHNHDAQKGQISTLYWINYITAIISFLLVVSTVPFAADYYKKPELVDIVFWASLSILITPFFITHLKILERDMRFDVISKIIIVSTFLSALIAGITAYMGYGIYALVAQILSMTVFKMVLVLIFTKWSPTKEFDYKGVKDMVWYSVKYKASQGVLYFERNIDYLILGKIFSSTILGYYAFSYNIMYTPVKRISNIFSDVLFPSFSKIKNDKEKIITGYFKSMQLISLVSFPVMALIALNAEWIIISVFGDKWIGAIPILEILCFAGAFQSIGQFGGVVFSSIGKPEISLYVAISRTILTILAIIGGSFYGIIAIAYFILASKIISWLIILATVRYKINFPFKHVWDYLKGTFICIFILFISEAVFFEIVSAGISPIFKLVIQTILAGGIIMLFYSHILLDLYRNIRGKINIKANLATN